MTEIRVCKVKGPPDAQRVPCPAW